MTLAFDALDAPASPLTRLDPRWKLAALTLAGVAAAVLRDPRTILIAFMLVVTLLIFARLPVRLLRSRFAALAAFLLPFLVMLPILSGRDGLLPAAMIGARAVMLFSLALLVIATAPFHRTMQAAQALGIPRIMTQLLLISYRYLFVLRDEFLRIRTALRVRGFRAGSGRRTYQTVGLVAGSLLLRGEDRAERVAHAMRCRGFDGRFRSLSPFQTRPTDVMFLIAVAVTAAVLVALDVGLRL